MGIGGSDLIAIGITTTYDGSGNQEARADLKGLADAGKQATGALADLTKAPVQTQLGAFDALGKKIDVTSASAVQGYRAQGDALSANLVALGATDAELNQIGASIAKVERAAGASLLNPSNPNQIGLTNLPPKAKTAANGLAVLAQAAVSGGGSLSGMASAIGNLSTGLATLATSAKVAASATAIGLIIQLLATGYEIVKGFTDKTKELNYQIKGLESTGRGLADTLGGNDLAAQLEHINAAADKEIEQQDKLSFLYKDQGNTIKNEINANRQKSIKLAKEQYANEAAARFIERREAIYNAGKDLEIAQQKARGDTTDLELAKQQLDIETQQRENEINKQFVRRSASGAIIELTEKEKTQRNELLAINTAIGHEREHELELANLMVQAQNVASQEQGSADPRTQLQGKLDAIQLAKDAEIKATGDVLTATLRAEQAKRQLMTESAAIISRSWLSLGAEIVRSMNTSIEAGKSLKGVLLSLLLSPIAAELRALAESEAVKAVAHFATGDIGGGAAHTVASGLATAAASRVASWGGGGGGAGSGGGASAGPIGNGPTFTPRDQQNQAATVVNLYTTDPYGRENIMTASYYLTRAGVLNRPVYLPPTTGLQPRGA